MERKIFLVFVTFIIMGASSYSQTGPDPTTSVVNGGIKLQANASSIILKNVYENLHSTPNIGGELGGFIDFNVSKHFFIQFNLVLFAEHNDFENNGKSDKLWTYGMEIPVYALARFGNEDKGYVYFGGGPFTEFSLMASMTGDSGSKNPYKHVVGIDNNTGAEVFALSDNHSGLAVYLGYELPCGFQINASYQHSISDILAFSHGSNMSAHPYKFVLGAAWRF